jgi:nudix-type nucleoside diphosphatase (YffH/AdpP family)
MSKQDDDISARIKLRDLKILSGKYYSLRLASFDYQRGDGSWQQQQRESYDLGDAAAVLPHDRARDRVLLIRQFRWPVFESGYRHMLIEAIAGKLDSDSPADCATREAMEEAGVTITNLRLVSHCFTSPGAVKERTSLFLADYDSTAARAQGGGHEQEGEDITVLEISLDAALAMVESGEIADMKTVLLLLAAVLQIKK